MKNTILFLSLIVSSALLSQEGELDLSFNGDGKYILDLSYDDAGKAVLIQPDEKILIGGSVYQWEGNAMVTRLNRYGNPDLSFGNQGVSNPGFPDYHLSLQDMALQSGNNIIVLAESNYNAESGMFLTRLNDKGKLDVTFADSGKVNITGWYGNSYWKSVIVMPDEKIVVGGYAYFSGSGVNGLLLGFTKNGSPNLAFGDSGLVKFDLTGGSVDIQHLTLSKEGDIVAVGSGYSQGNRNFLVALFSPDGSLKTGFGGGGIATVPLGQNASAYDIALSADGSMVIAGEIYENSRYQFAVTKILSDGSIDQGFGNNGKAITPILQGDATAVSVSILGDGKILVAGEAEGIWNRDFALVRYQEDGSLDKSFSLDGIATKNIGNDNDQAVKAAIQPNGRLVLVGTSFDNNSGTNVISVARFLGGEGTVDIEEWEGQDVIFTLYPNPARDWLRVKFDEDVNKLQLQLIDQRGSIVKQLHTSGYTGEIALTGLSPGLYLLSVKMNERQPLFRKVIVE